MRTRSRGYLIGLVALLGAALGAGPGAPAAAQEQGSDGGGAAAAAGRAILLDIDGAIGPATTDYLRRALEDAADEGDVGLVVVRVDTPGGLLEATRDIVRAIRSSPVPVATWVAPEGARAASAGTYILYASHVAAMAPATNVGAATPVSMGDTPSPPRQDEPAQQDRGDDGDGDGEGEGEGEGEGNGEADDGAEQPAAVPDADAKRSKAVNDAAAWIRSLAQETGRNAEWAEKAVREGVSVTAQEAVEQNVADFIAASLDEVLQQAHGRSVEVLGQPQTLATEGLLVERREPDWRSELLAVITNPTVAYLLLMIGIYGLLLEGYNPGSLVPGTIGAISLLLALYAFQVLPVNYAGLLLIILGILLIVAEAFAPSFGVLGIGGVVAMVVGSIILMDTDVPGFGLPLEVIAAVGLFCSIIMLALVMFAVRAWRRPVVSGAEGVVMAHGETLEPVDESGGTVHTLGERWQARSDRPIAAGTRVRVISREGLVLHVEADPEQEE